MPGGGGSTFSLIGFFLRDLRGFGFVAAFSAPWVSPEPFLERLVVAFFAFLLVERLRGRLLAAVLRFPRRAPPWSPVAVDFSACFFAAFERDRDLDFRFLLRVVVAAFAVFGPFARERLRFRDEERGCPAAGLRPLRAAAWEPFPEDFDVLAFFLGLLATAPPPLFRATALRLRDLDRDLVRDLARAECLAPAIVRGLSSPRLS